MGWGRVRSRNVALFLGALPYVQLYKENDEDGHCQFLSCERAER